MSKSTNVEAVVFPNQQEFEIVVGNFSLGSRTYANSSNAYRGCRSALRNLLKNRNVTNESNYGSETVAITNNNGFVLATHEYSKSNAASKTTKNILEKTKGIKKAPLYPEYL